jgi:hypothetical protein
MLCLFGVVEFSSAVGEEVGKLNVCARWGGGGTKCAECAVVVDEGGTGLMISRMRLRMIYV